VPLPHLLYPRGRGYKEGNRVGYNMITIMTLSLLGEHAIVLWNLLDGGRVIVDPSLGLLSLCGVVPRVPILVSSPRVLGK
jgi:hypothetical protein